MRATPHPVLGLFHPAVRDWFIRSYQEPSPAQAMGWPVVADGRNMLLLAPTGSGKTLAAFLQCIDQVCRRMEAGEELEQGPLILYVSPLKALNNDIHKNLIEPLNGIAGEARRSGFNFPSIRAAVRTGDTSAGERRSMRKIPPHILITTPESLFLMLSSSAREMLRQVRYVILDEIHALFPNKRGVHLAASLERLEYLTGHPLQRIGLSATQRPLEEVAAFLGGGTIGEDGCWQPRPVTVVDTGQRKQLDFQVISAVDDFRDLPEPSIWPAIYRQLLELVQTHQSTLVFVNNRRLAERITANLNDLAGHRMALTHHGSLSREQRLEAEDQLKTGKLPCMVATSSLELGIDVGAIDLVVQVESPKEVSRCMQRVGRAGHLVGLPSKGRVIPKTRADLLDCAALAREMRRGLVEEAHTPENCLDVLAQQFAGMACDGPHPVDAMFAVIRGSYPFRNLPRPSFEAVLDMLSGGYDARNFSELEPRIYWDRVNGTAQASALGRRLVYTSGGTIPDRGYFGVYLAGSGARLGELDEEFVAERRLGERFVLGTTTWRIEELRRDRVIVSPAGRGDGHIPFWRGEGSGRTYELGCRIGQFYHELEQRLERDDFGDWVTGECMLQPKLADNLRSYLRAQIHATGCLPTHHRIVVEEFQDELGGWRVMIHTPFGGRIHAGLGLLLRAAFREQEQVEAEVMHDDSGILMHFPGAQAPPRIDFSRLPLDQADVLLAHAVRANGLFALLFRHNASRALLLPRGPYGRKRTPLWLARLRASDLLQAISGNPDFPIVMETMRECLQETFDFKGLCEVLQGIHSGEIALHRCGSRHPSPFSQALQFSFFGTYMYVTDMPKGEQRFRALGMNRQMLRDLLGGGQIRALLSNDAITGEAGRLRGLADNSRPRSADELHAWLLATGEWRDDEEEGLPPEWLAKAHVWLRALSDKGRVSQLRVQGMCGEVAVWIAAEDGPLYQALWGLEPDTIGSDSTSPDPARPDSNGPETIVSEPSTSPDSAGLDPNEALVRILRRFARTRGPFALDELVHRFMVDPDRLVHAMAVLEGEGQVQKGEFKPGGTGMEWCETGVLQRLHRRSLARARREIAPRDPAAFAAFLCLWQGIQGGQAAKNQALATPAASPPFVDVRPVTDPPYMDASPAMGTADELYAHLFRLRGYWLPAPAWGGGVLPVRVPGFKGSQLDALLTVGRLGWIAQGKGSCLKLAFFPPGQAVWSPGDSEPESQEMCPVCRAILALLEQRGALFLQQIVQHTGNGAPQTLEALELLIGQGLVTNDTRGPVDYFQSRHPGQGYTLTNPWLARMGRWSRVEFPLALDLESMAEMLLQRYGIVTREAAVSENLPWSELSGVYDRWEAVGRIRRGYFIRQLGGAQYAEPGTIDLLREADEKTAPGAVAMLWRDPANPYGRILPLDAAWKTGMNPEYIVLKKGRPVMFGSGRPLRISTVASLDGETRIEAIGGLIATAALNRAAEGKLTVVEIDGRPVLQDAELVQFLQTCGFERGYRQMDQWLTPAGE